MTKSILTVMSFLLLSTLTFAGSIPTTVQKVFDQKFPNATSVKWDKENAHEYEASFEWRGEKHSANISDSGEWLETESVSSFNKLPEKVQTAFNASHKGATVKAVATIQTYKGVTKYEVEFKQGVKTVELFYTADGNETK
jgi:hypothetical protein